MPKSGLLLDLRDNHHRRVLRLRKTLAFCSFLHNKHRQGADSLSILVHTSHLIPPILLRGYKAPIWNHYVMEPKPRSDLRPDLTRVAAMTNEVHNGFLELLT